MQIIMRYIVPYTVPYVTVYVQSATGSINLNSNLFLKKSLQMTFFYILHKTFLQKYLAQNKSQLGAINNSNFNHNITRARLRRTFPVIYFAKLFEEVAVHLL